MACCLSRTNFHNSLLSIISFSYYALSFPSNAIYTVSLYFCSVTSAVVLIRTAVTTMWFVCGMLLKHSEAACAVK